MTPITAHPVGSVTLAGTGFGDSEAVDVYIDNTDTVLLVSRATGTLSGTLATSASIQPGKDFVTAIGRHSGDAAQVSLGISTQWLEMGYGDSRLDDKPLREHVNDGQCWVDRRALEFADE